MNRLLALVLLLTAGLLALTLALPATAEVPTVVNPREAPAHRTLAVREVWRVGADDDAEYVFGTIITATTDTAGNIYPLDSQTQTVHAFGPAGDYRGETARQGEGPGEIRMVYQLRMWDAGHLGCLQVFPARIITVGTDGTPGTTVDLRRGDDSGGTVFITAESCDHRDGVLICLGRLHDYDGKTKTETTFLASFHADGRERHRFASQPTGYDFSGTITVDEEKDDVPWRRWTLGPGGEIFLAPERNEYIIEVRDLDGHLLRRITRDVEPRRRTPEQKEAVKQDYIFSSDGAEIPDIRYRISDIEPPLHGLAWRDDMLWVRTTRGREADFPTFDIYDADGRLVEERRYDVPLENLQDNLVILPGGRLVRIANLRAAQTAAAAGLKVVQGDDQVTADVDEDAVLEVIVYEVID